MSVACRPWLQPPCHRLPCGNRPSNGKVVPHLHNHYHSDRKSFWETINVVLRDLKKNKQKDRKKRVEVS